MINLLPIGVIIRMVAVSYAGIVAALVVLLNLSADSDLYASFRIALGGGIILDTIFFCLVYFFWEQIWSTFPSLNTILFPNMNGKWKMKIHWQGLGRSGTVDAIAVIKQNLLRISMEVTSTASDSETLMAHPKKDPESGRPVLYYVYRVVPKYSIPNAGHTYEGTAILKFYGTSGAELSGNYFTSMQTKGRFVLTR